MERIELADAVAAIREELLRGAVQGADSAVRFAVGPVELEFEVELAKEASASGKVKAWVFEAGVEGGTSHRRTHRVKVTLTPQTGTGEDFLIGSRRRRPTAPGGSADRHDG
ncbi:trypco2 family protein [Kitasatospora sp. NPDC001540]|uniref:trypco2 family protein n=1 Tax=Kitasatospora sp. NPDC001540 TaxID=3364014 RepID=UPI0036AAA47D